MRTAMFQTAASAPAAGIVVAHQYQAAAAAAHERSPWHSPVPYLFGGLAAMLGLIAFSLLLLACSYWKLSGYLEGGNGDPEGGEGKPGNADAHKLPPLLPEQRIVVIMAGDDKPTFLATPMSSRASSLGDNAGAKGCGEGESKVEGEKVTDADPRISGTGSHEHREEDTHDQNPSGEAESRQSQDLLQAVEETHRRQGSSH